MERRRGYGGKQVEEGVCQRVGGDDASVGACGLRAEEVGSLGVGTRNDRVRHPRRRARGHSDTRDHGFPPAFAGALERNRGRNQRIVAFKKSQRGQSTVEFAIVTVGFIAVTLALSALWHALGDGLLVEHALAVASHHIQGIAPATLVDLFLY